MFAGRCSLSLTLLYTGAKPKSPFPGLAAFQQLVLLCVWRLGCCHPSAQAAAVAATSPLPSAAAAAVAAAMYADWVWEFMLACGGVRGGRDGGYGCCGWQRG